MSSKLVIVLSPNQAKPIPSSDDGEDEGVVRLVADGWYSEKNGLVTIYEALETPNGLIRTKILTLATDSYTHIYDEIQLERAMGRYEEEDE